MRQRVLVTGIALVVAAAVSAASAQTLLSQRKVLSAVAAKRLVDACMEFGARMPEIPLAIAVVDPAGNLMSFHAMENATETAGLTAQLKAKTAARWRRQTSELFDRVNNNVNRAPEFVGDFPQSGGYPLFIEGELVGAVGAGGGGGNQDNLCAEHAIRTVFGAAAVAGRPQ
jgi:glc operon protein GlcG